MIDEKQVELINNNYHFNCKTFYDKILIGSNFGNDTWICTEKKGGLLLSHKNKNTTKLQTHIQKPQYFKSLLDVFDYISQHDKHVLNDRDGCSRISQLFQSISI